jgi:hypothetical protein
MVKIGPGGDGVHPSSFGVFARTLLFLTLIDLFARLSFHCSRALIVLPPR